MGESDQSKAIKDQNEELSGFQKELKGLNVKTKNRFDNYDTPFGYDDISRILEALEKQGITDVNQIADQQIQQGQSDTAARMASQGVTGGSVLNTATNAVRNPVNTQRFRTVSDLKGQTQRGKMGAMDMENRNKFMTTSAGQNVDFANMDNLFKKFGLRSNIYGQQMQGASMLDPTTWFDDVLAVGNTVGGFVPLMGGGGGGAKRGR
jgi:hypothetical protein